MRNYQPKYRWKLTEQQLNVLGYIHKFKFITTDILATILEKDRTTIYERISVLEKQGYLLKQYDSSYRIRRRSATYCLAPLGIRVLKDNPSIEQLSLRQNYKNKYLSEAQIDECLLLARVYLHFRCHYASALATYTKYQLTERDAYVRPTPLLSIQGKTDATPDYLLDIIPAGLPTWLIRKRITQHEALADESKHSYPHVLFAAGNDNTEKRIVTLTGECYNDFSYFTTTIAYLREARQSRFGKTPKRRWSLSAVRSRRGLHYH